MDKVLLIDKEKGWTSNDVVQKLKKVLQPKKIGHAGTLDPFATGLLIILLDEATKTFAKLQKLKKEYIAEIEFGRETDTYDIDGEVVQTYDRPIHLEMATLKKIFEKHFTGKILQTPPKYSALKIAGKPLYKLARQGRPVSQELLSSKNREVEIYEWEIIKLEENILKVRLLVSSGTYIRSIANDLGKLLGFGAYLKSLRRTRIGEYCVDDAKKLEK